MAFWFCDYKYNQIKQIVPNKLGKGFIITVHFTMAERKRQFLNLGGLVEVFGLDVAQ